MTPIFNFLAEQLLRKPGRNVILLFILVGIPYLSVLSHDFLSWLDESYILQNLRIRQLKPSTWIDLFTSPYLNTFQPVVWLSYALDYKLGGLRPFIYHNSNVVFHLLNCWLVYMFCRHITQNRLKAWLIALGFGLHPLQTEAVSWIASRNILLLTTGSLIFLIGWYRYLLTRNAYWYRISFAGFCIAGLSHPIAITLPVFTWLLEQHSQNKYSWGWQLRKKFPFIVLAFVWIWMSALNQYSADAFPSQWNIPEQIAVYIFRMGYYAGSFILPIHLSAWYSWPLHLYIYHFVFIVGLILIFIIWRWKGWGRTAQLGWGLWLIPQLPIAFLWLAPEVLMADRFHYLAVIGPLFLLVEYCWIVWKKRSDLHYPLRALGLILVVGWIGLTLHRIQLWNNNESIYSSILEDNPDVGYIRFKLADNFQKQNLPAFALQDYLLAIHSARISQDHSWKKYGYDLENKALKGAIQSSNALIRSQDALVLINRAVDKFPFEPDLSKEAGIACFRDGQDSLAIDWFRKYIRYKPQDISAWIWMSRAAAEQKNYVQAAEFAWHALEIDSKSGVAWYLLGKIEETEGNYGTARKYMRTSKELNYPEAIYWWNAGE
ncbi:MAG: hypothetical protein EBS07_04995 [Sphingobacteriia bacterium]|nr:hypothetical protein [Sphingobacteriia bacterium]